MRLRQFLFGIAVVTFATWNVNSIKARLPIVLDWLREHKPDVVMLQELKCITEQFPNMEIEDLGYNIAAHGQKTYNGVAILSRFPISDIETVLAGDPSDEQARYIEAIISLKNSAVRVASVYVPNGQEVGSDKFAYKLAFFERLHSHWQSLLKHREICVFGGDYNVAPEAIDVCDPRALDGSVCYHPAERAKLRALLHLGYYDAYRALNPTAHHYSWWDYRAGAYAQNKGLRIDHLLLSPPATDLLTKSWIDESPRGLEKASDHAPVLCELKIS